MEKKRKRLGKVVVLAILGLAVILALSGMHTYTRSSGKSVVTLHTATVTRGDLVVSIEATGTIEPEKVINVGAQVAGQILSFGNDISGKPIDYGSEVEHGTILAQIDDSLYLADVAQAKSQVRSAEAGVARSQADLNQMKAKMNQAENNWVRAKELGPSRALSATDYDLYKAAYETGKATVAVGEAAVLQAQASLAQAQTGLWRAQQNLGYCTIKSPIKGIIIDRRVNIGQTVVSSMNAPSLFLLAKDLKKMQVWVPVNEADIGKIHPGQRVRFTVDAFAGETFAGSVGKIRLNACMTQNVVTYTVEITTDNSNGRLLPYLTANVQFELNRRSGVLQIPNAALRWTPAAQQVAPAFLNVLDNFASGIKAKTYLWVAEDQQVRPVEIRTGLTNGIMTEVSGDGLTEGLKIAIGVNTTGSAETTTSTQGASTETTNPFTPKLPPPPKGVLPPR